MRIKGHCRKLKRFETAESARKEMRAGLVAKECRTCGGFHLKKAVRALPGEASAAR